MFVNYCIKPKVNTPPDGKNGFLSSFCHDFFHVFTKEVENFKTNIML